MCEASVRARASDEDWAWAMAQHIKNLLNLIRGALTWALARPGHWLSEYSLMSGAFVRVWASDEDRDWAIAQHLKNILNLICGAFVWPRWSWGIGSANIS